MIQRKVCLVGDFAVGKTSLFSRFIYNKFSEDYLTTVGVRMQRKIVPTGSGAAALILWDIEGGKGGGTVRESYLDAATGAVVVCDLTRLSTIMNMKNYVELLLRVNPAMQIVLAGNKLDLLSPDHAHLILVRRVAAQLDQPLTLTSASTGVGVEDMFTTLGERLIEQAVQQP